jgi:hypothetical protein
MKPALVAALLVSLLPLTVHAQAPTHPTDEHAAQQEKPAIPPSKSVNVSFEGRTITLTVEDLLNLPQVEVHVHNAHSNVDESYSGPLLADVLARVGLKASRETEPLILHSSLVATGTDHYFVIYSLAEVEPSFSTGKVIVAIMKSGLPNTDGSLIELVNTADAKPARWLRGLADLNVMSIAPTK